MKKLFLPVILAVLILTACGETPTPARPTITPLPPRPTPNAAELQITDPGQTIEVKAGEDFTIAVRTNLSTEYHWEVAQELDSNVVEYVWKDHVPDNPNAAVSSGTDVWRFKAVAPGETTITLGYYQGMTDHTSQKAAFTIVVK